MIEGLDYNFLRYIGVVPEVQKRIQSFYLPFFRGCEKVVDLGCGDGDFVELLSEKGFQALGVDYDPKTCAVARERGINIICMDVFDYLAEAESDSVDGIFSAHLVEHLPYEKVLDLLRQSYRVLRKGGVIVLVTPNVRGLFSHLEMFYMHFGHVSFYHPRLLCFFLEYVGFVDPKMGENPETVSPLLVGIQPLPGKRVADSGQFLSPIIYEWELPHSGNNIYHRFTHWLRKFWARRFVHPFLDQIVAQLNSNFARMDNYLAQIKALDRPFECYVFARKES